MGQKVHPTGMRLGIIKKHNANWYAKGKDYPKFLNEDLKVREYIGTKLKFSSISKVELDRSAQAYVVNIHSSRPGIIIGKGGSEVDKLKGELKKLTGKDIQINIFEIKRPEVDAKLIGDSIAQQLRARISHRRAMKQAIASAVRVGAKGIKVKVSGRIGGAEMARSEQYKEGRTPLHTIRADIDYAICESQTIYGKIGVKVWVYKGEVVGKRNLSLNVGSKNAFKA